MQKQGLKIPLSRRENAVLLSLTGLLVLAALGSLLVGRFNLSPAMLLKVFRARLTGKDPVPQADNIIFIIRLPRIFLAMLVGAALSLSGAAYQSLFKDPLVSPGVLGVTSGAGFGAALGILFSLPSVVIQSFAFIFGLITVAAVLSLTQFAGKGRNSTVILILTGTIMNALFSSVISFTKYVADADNKLPEITFWLMGSFARSGNNKNVLIMLGVLLVAGTVLFLLRWKINILSFSDEEARSMGVNTRQVRTVVILASTLLTAASVSLCGIISWVGLIIPHIARLLVGPNNQALFPVSLLGGALFMLLVDNCARALIPGELPVGVLVSFIGAPLFLYMLFCGKKEWL
ncbi:HmuU protein [Treponema primitia ZAS-2]|uniref:HmuU protein n=1 Tax=Treponema primitia (strain ATCC BAA-887 / DSM 12427 / ZAS-2) TaxID=545694 RepID=F5YR07_TREPZ|nr:iron ABC transporter permease [Treponema primitia]AEF83975.1 HmuU protein [Treponema primitia ZAS-2]